MNTTLVVYADGHKRPQMISWQGTPGGAEVPPVPGMDLVLLQFKNPFFKIERFVANVQQTAK